MLKIACIIPYFNIFLVTHRRFSNEIAVLVNSAIAYNSQLDYAFNDLACPIKTKLESVFLL